MGEESTANFLMSRPNNVVSTFPKQTQIFVRIKIQHVISLTVGSVKETVIN